MRPPARSSVTMRGNAGTSASITTVGSPLVSGACVQAEVIEQEWNEPTGRLTVDWKPALPFTSDTLIYGSLAHGYKAGGANPPPRP